MDDKMNIPPYIIKQMIAGTLYERKNHLVQKARDMSELKVKKQSEEYDRFQNYVDSATNIGELANQIRMGNIPLDQCLEELTIDEKKIDYHKCREWYEQNHENKMEDIEK